MKDNTACVACLCMPRVLKLSFRINDENKYFGVIENLTQLKNSIKNIHFVNYDIVTSVNLYKSKIV